MLTLLVGTVLGVLSLEVCPVEGAGLSSVGSEDPRVRDGGAEPSGLEAPPPRTGAALANPGFEDPDPLVAWKTWIYKDGRDPTIRLDTEAREGKRSLLVEALDPADVALGQGISLPSGTVWRVSTWVRTEGLVARDSTDVGATVHVQTPDGATIARGDSSFGTTDWRQVVVPFRVPASGCAKIALFFVGYGKGTGKVWFDGVRLEELSRSGPEEIRITAARLSSRPVDPKQGGQFIEPLCGLIPSLIAQQVASTSFEDEPPWNVAFRRDIDRPHRPWYPDGAVHVARYVRDPERPFNGKVSQRIEILAPRARAGISQDGYCVEEGLAYRIHLGLRAQGDIEPRASLHAGGAMLAGPVSLGRVGEAWRAVDTTLRSTLSEDNATLSVEFEGPGTLWIDRVSLIREDATLGLWRPDVVAAIRELRPGVIRFGGSALETYEWEKCVGPSDERSPFPQAYWGGIEENFVGVEEFVALCVDLGVEPLVCVRWSGKRPEDAAAEVEYFNGPPESPWGSRRAKNGHREPYGVKFWQVGNEVSGREYDGSVRSFAEAMRRVDPSIRVLSSFPSEDTVRQAIGELDYLCPHHYGCADLLGMDSDFNRLRDLILRFGGGRDVRVAVTEWNTTAGDWDLGRASLQTLGNALHCARYHNLMQRNADLVEMAIRSNLIDSFCSGAILTGPGWLYVSPTYHAQVLYSRGAGGFPLRVTRSWDLPWQLAEPDVSAILSADGKTLRVYAVNSTSESLDSRILLDGLGPTSGGTASVLADSERGGTPEALNLRDEPRRVRVEVSPVKVAGREIPLRFAPLSLTLLELEVR